MFGSIWCKHLNLTLGAWKSIYLSKPMNTACTQFIVVKEKKILVAKLTVKAEE